MGRQTRYRSDSEYIAFMRRCMRAARGRLDNCDLEQLREMVDLRLDLEDAIAATAYHLSLNGESWSDIGRATGTSRQAAWEKWSKPRPGVGAEAQAH